MIAFFKVIAPIHQKPVLAIKEIQISILPHDSQLRISG